METHTFVRKIENRKGQTKLLLSNEIKFSVVASFPSFLPKLINILSKI